MLHATVVVMDRCEKMDQLEETFFLQSLVFPKVLHNLAQAKAKFKIVVLEKNTQSILGSSMPYFSSLSPSECSGCEKNSFQELRVSLMVNKQVVLTKLFAIEDLEWHVTVENQQCSTDEALRFVRDSPYLAFLPVKRTRISANTLAAIEANKRRNLWDAKQDLTASKTHLSEDIEDSMRNQKARVEKKFEYPVQKMHSEGEREHPISGHMSLEEEEIANPMQKMRLADEDTDSTPKLVRYMSIFMDVMHRWGKLVDWRLDDPGCLMEHQKKQLLEFKKSWDAFQLGQMPTLRGLVVAPMGTGKTISIVLAPYLARIRSTLVITPGIDLRSQIAQAFSDPESCVFRKLSIPNLQAWTSTEGLNFLPENSERETKEAFITNINADLNVVNVHNFLDSSVLNLAANSEIDLVIIDEAHHIPVKSWRKILEQFSSKTAFLLFTATPTHKGRSLLEIQPDLQLRLLHEFTREEAVKMCVIRGIEYRSKDIGEPEDTLETAFVCIANAVQKALIAHDEIGKSHRYRFHQAIVFTRTTKEAETFVRLYNSSENVQKDRREGAEIYSGGNVGREVLKRFRMGSNLNPAMRSTSFRTIVSASRLSEGFDHPNVSVIGIARSVKSRKLFEQQIGRAVRRRRISNDAQAKDPITTAVVISHPHFGNDDVYNSSKDIAEALEDDEDDADRENAV